MTKEKIIDAVLNSKVLEIYNAQNCRIYAASWISREEVILSVCSKSIIVIIYDDRNKAYIYSHIPFKEIAKIVILKKEVIE